MKKFIPVVPSVFGFLCFIVSITFLHGVVFAQQVQVGLGSYSTSLPPGAVGPQIHNGLPATPKTSPEFDQPVQTNDFWSSLIFPFFGDPYSAPLFAHPLLMRPSNNGLQIGYTPTTTLAGQDYLTAHSNQFTVSIDGLNASQATTHSYSDWMVTSEWDDGSRQLTATFGHGNPFIFFELSGGNAAIYTTSTPTIWFQENEVLGMTIDGRHYGVFAPTGSSWTVAGALFSSLNGKSYLSVALLPDNSTETLSLFRDHAYAFVTNSEVSWEYDESTATLNNTYTYTTELKDSADGNLNNTLSALYSHQWRYVNEPLTNFSYSSVRGEMKLYNGNSFSTSVPFSGVLPSLPDEGAYDRNTLLTHVQQIANETLNPNNTYDNGKAMGRFANVIHIADQLGATTERDMLLAKVKTRLEDWFTVGGAQEYSYNADWNVLTGYPSAHASDAQINDHHFHHAYAIGSAAAVARYDSTWASQENWGGMVNMLIEDASNWDRNNTMFPFLRNFDIYAGHSWASGHAAFGDGNNQESSSESMNYASSLILWGELTNQKNIRDLGIFLYATEATAINDYWFDVQDEVFPSNYAHNALGIVWGGKGVYGTWFGAEPEFIHGINFLPLTAGSFYLGQHPDYILENYNKMVSERGGDLIYWKDIFWQYLAMSDPDLAMSNYLSEPNYTPFDGESRAKTMHWMYNFKKMGILDATISADIPTYAVFKNKDEVNTYVAYNAGSTSRLVSFSDGFSMTVEPKELKSMASSSVDSETEQEFPASIRLYQNYPNPFNPSTIIRYSMPESATITLQVFDATGRLISTLEEGVKSAGNHSVEFDASNLSSGIYYYRLTSNDFSISNSMLLIK